MTAVANPPSFQQTSRSAWSANVSQGGLNSMNADEVARMFMPRKSAQRANSSSSIASTSSTSSTATISPQVNGVPMAASGDLSQAWGTAAARKKTQRIGPWPASKAEAVSGITTTRPQSMLTTNGGSTPSSLASAQPAPVVPSQHLLQSPSQQMNGSRPAAQPVGEGNPVLYLLSMNGTFERKTISVPFYPDSLRIGRQTNAKTVPTPANGFFDSKVLSRQHAEIWADRQGKVWIRDVKSSNGTFVNGSRLSAENRDSEPHELQTQDHLELGIDIVSEDQKTVVHHKVAAKVEHAGFLGSSNNVLEMNFGDLDPANGAMMLPSQGPMQMRGRSSSQGSVGSNGRLGPPASVAGSQMSGISQQRPMNFWLTPVTTEQIVKRLTNEMRAARLQTNDLGRADVFFGSLLSKDDIRENEKSTGEQGKGAMVNGGSLPFRTDSKPRFSDPPAPPPQQPLPEKPDVARSHAFEPSSPSLKRSNTERPKSVPAVSPVRQEPTSQIITLVEALASAKKEIDVQGARLRDLEEMLQKERHAREMAEELAKRLELQTEAKTNGEAKGDTEGSVIEEAFEPPTESAELPEQPASGTSSKDVVDPTVISESTTLLEKKLESMLVEMQGLRDDMESFKRRAETAETERDADRKSLAEMVEKIRSEESARRSSSTERARLPSATELKALSVNGVTDALKVVVNSAKEGLSNGSATISADGNQEPGQSAVGTLARPPGSRDLVLYNTSPYASMLGVVLIGMGLMAYLNGWQPPKVDR
ncbi:cytoplasm to vacuole targeting protein-like protein Vps64 [Mollisia scopiformis]|uniref:Cytoplasm to vacuole targeting protein-like protein Vps64 n=1 Tax=Mollisia scopiformis TaxID=149040 RepID=A0A194X243_MOLSC|nr:cytoplasm to vacuole targeting protein-like protein Vps64 [Mollisia scopiformis]KUJ13912.1 cytoplasm to vacuole targeting protein-like protein Vps64 [Mollisia scopiformis]